MKLHVIISYLLMLRLVVITAAGLESLEPFLEWPWSCFSGILFGIHNHYILQTAALVCCMLIYVHLTPYIPYPHHSHASYTCAHA